MAAGDGLRRAETVIIRLPPPRTDVLSGDRHWTEDIVTLPEAEARFADAARPVMDFLAGYMQPGIADAHLDRWAQPPVEHGDLSVLEPDASAEVAAVANLLPSNALAVTGTPDVIAAVKRAFGVQVHRNYAYNLPSSQRMGGRGNSWHLDALGIGPSRDQGAGAGVDIALLDTGIDVEHPEFANLHLSAFAAWDPLGRPIAAESHDTHWHGTHVAGLLCGSKVGVAPEATLRVGLIAPRGQATFAQMNAGLEWAVRDGARIISMSVGKPGVRPELQEAIAFVESMGSLLVAAIGNNGIGADRSPGNAKTTLGVGASTQDRQVWNPKPGTGTGGGMMADGSWKPDVFAPGARVTSSMPGGGYASRSGTSMATPLVAGVAALVEGAMPGQTPAWLRQRLIATAEQFPIPAGLGSTGYLARADKAVAGP